ncbi:MAG TPA: NAD(P)/FAD-dependent oxidoreductase [Chthoniobacterales bacterium]|nr:NAD(P)/FAD-dependent oxidoreductase [Chthoniobacterales bacterium]
MIRIGIAGGGAAGFFAAIASARANRDCEVSLFERSSQFLSKVRISGGGRCNVTHSLFDPRMFAMRYPRGERELISPFHRFSAQDTMDWFESRGVRLKRENDGRIFPTSDSSETIVECLITAAKVAGVRLFTRKGIQSARVNQDGGFDLELSDGSSTTCDRLLLATGGARSVIGAEIARSLGHTIESPVPSLFALQIGSAWLQSLPGVSLEDVELSVGKLCERGALLITHHGLSGPAVLRLSAWGARALHAVDYHFPLRVNWLPAMTEAALRSELRVRREQQPKKRVVNSPVAALPIRLWEKLVSNARISPDTIWTALSREGIYSLVRQLRETELQVHGKSMNKDEFVTCGGVSLREINFKTMESRIRPRLYFAGELLDIDGITGGFNFQAAWTTGWIAGHAMAGVEPNAIA